MSDDINLTSNITTALSLSSGFLPLVAVPHSNNDDFTGSNGDPPDTDKWTEDDSSDAISIQNNKLNFDTSGPILSYCTSNWYFEPNQDFKITIDWDFTTLTKPIFGSSKFGLAIGISDFSTYSIIRRYHDNADTHRYESDGSATSTRFVSTIDTSGKFKIQSISGEIRVSYWTGIDWEWDESSYKVLDEDYTGENVYAVLWFGAGFGSDVNCNLDNFEIVIPMTPVLELDSDILTALDLSSNINRILNLTSVVDLEVV